MADDVQIRFGADASAAVDTIADLKSALSGVEPTLDRLNATYLRTFRSTMQIMVDLKRISAQQALELDLDYTARLHDQERERLLGFIDSNSEMTGERLSTLFKLAEMDTQYSATAADNQRRLADQARHEAAQVAASYEHAFDRLGSSVQRSFNEMLTGQTSWARGSLRLVQQVESFFLAEIETMAAKWAASGLAGLAGGAVATAVTGAQAAGGSGLGPGLLALVGLNQPGGLFGSGLFAGTGGAAQAAAVTANTTALAASTTAMATLTAALTGATVASGGATAASTIGAAGSVAGGTAAASGGGLFSWLGGLFAFAKGGIVPSAAGGWVLPSFAGATPALLHAREMVLPAPISEGLQAMIGAGNGGGAQFHAHFHGPADAPAVSRWFRENMRQNAGAIRDMFRQNALTPRTL